ncbi:MAG: hypothetical protein A2268_11230 [Candidatus Raymondbacteria bacterium RifOxyA12_full_50_37]|uniref:BioF2-like acetyltransferase domain-containing protein n=1 Tax=Candidatus Raymondbacteria bacterium RIFOXYD12_FULL_49_13 TaxID=1817890 RepID=A0A1F7F7H7_UNCRA|nr:MAG: hypothetical protein A2268_11230 [Candidatus Raymondbacteria bacterium RifOxyA12_full_50_37]OGJ85579.1 MAG: hypothetical protein A2248_13015 [Candidatus Raymondbacteria bacterium RIFOXYA2_FULL_49_16]OGJ95082.1 MAG: hypothetical protein A2453_07715 [Candidatus Raymondbacteria bacterium RIFOXYC2_FULL_50_21]OGK02599.1 MAG: hypothetical protein A2519_12375 [Candidatus Raymondbacteria bacterium RIFOXYD12_FULL_49_13]OGP39276.1 MAG: hypothetical protein A2324_09320 [Candidatus Raymondbacteria 
MDHNIQVKVFRTFEELETIRDLWQAMVRHPNGDFDFYSTVVKARAEIKSPHVFVLFQDNKPSCMLIGRIEEAPMEIKLGYFAVAQPRLCQLTMVYGGGAGAIGAPEADIFLKSIGSLLKDHAFEAVLFNNLRAGSALHQAIRRNIGVLNRDHAALLNPHWTAVISRSPDDFLKKISRNHRYTLRRQVRLFETTFADKLAIRVYTRDEQVSVLCTDVERIAQKTYQRGIGAGFTHSPEMEDRLHVHARASSLRGYVLSIEGVPCAFWIGTLYKGVFYLDFTGYDAQYHAHAPGIYLFLKMVEDLCSNTAATSMDFGFGDADYKRRFGDTRWDEVSVMLFEGSLKGLALNLARHLTLSLTICINAAVSSTIVRMIKKKWRMRLGKKQNLKATQV